MQLQNLDESNVAIAGYDPVSYFIGEPSKGREDLTIEHQGAIYRFTTEANQKIFRDNPAKYAPQYGGFCAIAVSENKTFHVDPLNYIVDDDKLFLFYRGEAGDTKPQWEADPAARQIDADTNWEADKLELHHLETANQ